MSDGTTQVELSSEPVHYRDGKGKWQDIDTKVVAGAGEDAFENAKNTFRSRFGKSTDRLISFEADGVSIGLGAAGAKRKLSPTVEGSTVTFPDVFGTADVRYRVSPTGVKEDVVLAGVAEAASEYTFELHTSGLVAREQADGSIGFFKKNDDKLPKYVIPAPNMSDASAQNRIGQPGYSDKIRQTVTQQGGTSLVTLKPDLEWLTAKDRVFPIVLDPTIVVVPDPAASQDTSLSEANPTTLYGTNPSVLAGSDASQNTWRGLLKFDMSMIPAGTTIRSADLNMHFGASFGSDTNTVPFATYLATQDWSEATATWSSMSTSFSSGRGYNQVTVDDQDALSTSYEGGWKDQANSNAVGGGFTYAPSGTTPDAFTWDARVPGAGDYLVQAHYFGASYRGSPMYTLTGDAGSTTVPLDQTIGSSTGVWAPLATVHAAPMSTARVRMVRQGGATATTPIADAVSWTEYSTQTKSAGQRDAWHSFAMANFAQWWVNNPSQNFGVMLKGVDDSSTGPVGGLYYSASEDVYGAETAARPSLVMTYDEPGVTLNAPTTIQASGPELTWSPYVDPTPEQDDNLVEYQIFRGCRTLPVGGCTSPVGDYFNTSTPGGLELVGTVASDVTAWTDQSAKASTATEPATYNYWVVARTVADTANGKDGRAASNVQTVTTPREGRVARAFSGDISDTTLSATQPTAVLARPDGGPTNTRYWMQVGNNHPTYGDERAVLEFDTSAIRQATKVTDARLELYSNYGSGVGTADFDLHALTRDFVESQATWNQATSTINWTKPGGDYDPTVLGTEHPSDDPHRLQFMSPDLVQKIQGWVDNPGDNHGFLLKTRDETASQQLLSITNSESPDTLFRPRLWVESLVKNDAETYEANEIPERFVPGTTVTTPVTVTNTSNTTWPAGLQLSYRWTEPNSSTDITVSGERNFVPLGKALAPGEAVPLDLPIRTPINSDTGAKRLAYDLYLDLWTGTDWFSQTNPPSGNTTQPSQGCAVVTTGLLCVDRYVEDPTSNQLGLEKFLSYTGEETGAGAQLLANLYSGNTVWSYDAMSNPSLGPSAFVRLAYNSMDVTDDGSGFGVSVQPSTLTRLGSRLSVPSGGSVNKLMTFIDGDGTTHTYKLDTQSASLLTYTRPAGVSLDLTRDLTADAAHQWVFSRPDGTRFFFDQDTGLQTSVVDRNGNTMSFSYDADGRLTTVRDASLRNALTLGYDTAGLVWIRDLSGRGLKFSYNGAHQLVKLEDGGSFDPVTKTFAAGAPVKTFLLGYTEQSTNSNAKLNSVKDPRNAETKVEYYTSTENSAYALWPKRYTDRRGNDTTFAYADPDSSAAKDIIATVTDVNGSTPAVTTYRMDGYGRTTSIKDANVNAAGGSEVTQLAWDSDHNVIRLQEPNGAVSTWEYSPVTGYPLKVRDAMAVKNGLAGVVLQYQTLTGPAHPTVLLSKTSAAGRPDTFTYDVNGNVKTVKNGRNYGPTYTYNANGTLATATDARGGLTKYETYDENGYPKSITDPVPATTEFVYDVRGNVTQVKDALLRVTTAEYDAFGRPVAITSPYKGTETRTTATEYDLNDNVTKQTAPNGAVTASTFDAADNVVTRSLPDNNTTGRQLAYSYDPLGRKVTETAPNGVASTTVADDFVTKFSYDRVGQVVKVETPFVDTDGATKTPTTTFGYDVVGNKTLAIDPNKNASAATDYTAKMVYDLNHRVTAVTDAAGYTSKKEYDADGLVTAEIDALGNKKRTDYDNAGQPIAIHVPHTPIGKLVEDRVTRLTYDEVGNVVRRTRPSGKYSETVYDANNRPVQNKSAFDAADTVYKTPSSTFVQYDPVGQVKAQSEPTFGAVGTQWTNFTYYESGDVKTSTDPWQLAATYDYNQVGQQTARTLTTAGDAATRTQAWGFYPDGALQSRSDTAAQQPVDVIDNADIWQATVTGTWATVTGGVNTQGTNYRTHAAAAVGTPEASDSVSWRVMPDVAGSFDVFASCPVRTDSTTAATYTINHSTGAATKTVDQKACTAANPWVNLGNYSFPGGVAKSVVLRPATSGVVVADAVKLVSTNPVENRSYTYSYDPNGRQTEVKDNNPTAATDTFKTSYDGLARASQVQELKSGGEKAKTDYGYDLNSNPLSTYAQRVADSSNPGVSRYTAYAWDVRNLIDTVRAGSTPTSSLDTWQYTYDPRGLRSTVTKPNGNVTTATYHADGLPRTLVEKTSGVNGGQLVSSHSLWFTADGDREQDVEKIDQAGTTEFLDQTSAYVYTPAQKLKSVTKTGVDKGDNESYVYDAAGNTTSQTIGATTSTMTYDRNRLIKTVSGATTMNHRYDAFGRSTTTDIGAQVVEQNAYDGYDRLVRQQKFDSAGTALLTRNQTFDPFDRVTFQAEKVGTQNSVSTRYTFVGLADQVAIEEQKDTTGAFKVSKSYAYGADGETLSLVDTPVNTTTTKKSYYGVNPHGDVETLTDSATGQTTSTYRYTAYGSPDKVGTTGDDAITGDPIKDADVVNPYRFNGKRFDGATGTYDMGFREYSPGLNRYLTRDMYNGALKDMALGSDPWNTNRYAFAGGNPITGIELDGHYAIDENGDQYTPQPQSAGKPTSTSQVGPGQSPLDWERANGGMSDDVDVNREALGNVLKDIGIMGLGAVVSAAGGSFTEGGAVVCGTGVLCPAGAIAIVGGVAISAAGAAVTTTGAQRFNDDFGRLFNASSGPAKPGTGGTSGGDLGPGWTPRPTSEICDSSGCERVAAEIQSKIGGETKTVTNKFNPPGGKNPFWLGKYRDQDTLWKEHTVVVRDGRVYDAFTDRYGEPIDQWKNRWDDPDMLNFGF
jgi:RHS repeat-associated protein